MSSVPNPIIPITDAPSLRDADLHRLARSARQRDFRVFYYPHTREHYAAAMGTRAICTASPA